MNQKELEQNQIQKRSKIQPKPKLEKSKKKNRSEQLKRKIKTKSGKKNAKTKARPKAKKAKPKQKKQTMFSLFWFFLSLFLLFSTSYIFEGPGHQVTWERQTHEKTSEKKKRKKERKKKQPNINVFSGLLFFGCWCVFKIVVWFFFAFFPGFGHGEWLPFTSTGLEQPCQQCPVLSLCQWLLKRLPLGLQNGNNKVAGLCMSISSSK